MFIKIVIFRRFSVSNRTECPKCRRGIGLGNGGRVGNMPIYPLPPPER